MNGRDAGGGPKWATPLAAGAAFAVIAFAESRRPLRSRRESKRRRFARNLTTAVLTAVVTSALQKPTPTSACRGTPSAGSSAGS
jgi:hypothetical protein